MKIRIYWIKTPAKGSLAILPRPRGGDWLADDVKAWHEAGIDVVVSTLTSLEVADLNLNNQAAQIQLQGMAFLQNPIEDRGVPRSFTEIDTLVSKLKQLL